MNRQQKDVLKSILDNGTANQRMIAELTGHSVGSVNKCIKELIDGNYIDDNMCLTKKAMDEFEKTRPENAIILAAGFGMRMLPVNTELPKGLLEVKGEVLIERTIRQLHEVGIKEIYVVVGFMKEQYEYLIDKFDVKLVVNPDYATKNNLYSLNKVLCHVSNSYIIPCDVWCENNPYNKNELYTWYMVSESKVPASTVGINRKKEAILIDDKLGNAILGTTYITKNDADILKTLIEEMCKDGNNSDKHWDDALFDCEDISIAAKVMKADEAVEINTYEQLREIDESSSYLKSDAMKVVLEVMDATLDEIKNVTIMKKGLTNRSFLFECRNKRYIMRIPGKGANETVNREEEATVYNIINDKNICDNILYINPKNGYKITEYIEDVRTCDPLNPEDVSKCMKKLREFHNMKFKVEHTYDLFWYLEYYEKLWNGRPSIYRDYAETKKKIYELKDYIEEHAGEYVLSHIDPNYDNFLFTTNDEGEEEIKLIDWEYASMQDPDFDLASFSTYAMYNKEQIDRLIDSYFPEGCTRQRRINIYCYVAIYGLCTSNWCEYKRSLGNDFGEYSIMQYRYAKEFYKIAKEAIEE